MRLEHQDKGELEKKLTEIVSRHLDLDKYRLFFFGSRVRGQGREGSDIDVGIEGPAPVPWQVMSEIEEEIDDLDLLYSVDFVDFSSVSNDFRREYFPIPKLHRNHITPA